MQINITDHLGLIPIQGSSGRNCQVPSSVGTTKRPVSRMGHFRCLRLAIAASLGLCLGNVVWAKPAAQSIQISPNPLTVGQSFTIVVTASPDVTQVTATVDFHPGNSQSLEIAFTRQGRIWTGVGIVPVDLHSRHPEKGEAKVKVLLLDAAHHPDEEVVHVDVDIPTVFAIFAGGILTVRGDDEDNTLVVSPTPPGRSWSTPARCPSRAE